MGIDAEMMIRYRGPAPSDDQIARWSWELCNAIGAARFFTTDGLRAQQYATANKTWHEAFASHPQQKEFSDSRPGEDRAKIHASIIADIGPFPQLLRRAICLSGESSIAYADPLDEEIGEEHAAPGKHWTQDGPVILAEPGETLLSVSLNSRYYGPGYERGDILTLCAVAEWIELNMQPCEVWYGGDSSGVLMEPFGPDERKKMREHLFSSSGRDYFKYSGMPSDGIQLPGPCGLCIPGEPRFNRNGWGPNYAAYSCGGCGKTFVTQDGGKTFFSGAQAVSAESGKGQAEGPDFPPLPEVWMVDWVASKTGEHYQEFHDSEAGAFLTAAQLAAATPAMPARITQLNPDPVRAALVEALQIARPYVEWSDESRSPEDYPESAEILRKKQLMIDAALKAAGVVLP